MIFMTPLILAAAAALALASDASQAPTQPPSPTTTVATATTKAQQPDPNKVICKDEELTGSRFTQRVCKTRAQWTARQDAADNYKRTIEDRNGLQGAPSGPFGQ
jgi:hypothetical protein